MHANPYISGQGGELGGRGWGLLTLHEFVIHIAMSKCYITRLLCQRGGVLVREGLFGRGGGFV